MEDEIMKDSDNLSSMESSLLKECYALAAEYEQNSTARDILRSRGRKITVTEEPATDNNTAGFMASNQTAMSDAIYELTMKGGSGYNSPKLRQSLSRMKFCGDREFLLAILALSNGRGETERIEALQHISLALSYSPNDPRYISFAQILQQYDK